MEYHLYTILNRKIFVWINKIYLCVRTNLIIYVIVTEYFLLFNQGETI